MAYEALRCPNCGAPLENGQKFCDHCGIGLKSTDENESRRPGINITIDGKEKSYNYNYTYGNDKKDDEHKDGYGNNNNTQTETNSYKKKSTHSKDIALILALISLFFTGGIAIHKIYLNKIGSFVLSIIFVWTGIPLIIALVNVIQYAIMNSEEFEKRFNV